MGKTGLGKGGGTLTKEQLEEITGSPVVTQQIMDSLAANDLPATEENVQDSAEALAQAASIPEITKRELTKILRRKESTLQTQLAAGRRKLKEILQSQSEKEGGAK